VDIAAWLRALGLEQYEPAFRDNAVGTEVLRDITDHDLVLLGVQSLGHRKKLLRAIVALGNGALLPGSTNPSLPGATDYDPERRHVTVLFADLVGSTELAARLDPEDLRDVLRGYHAHCAALVQRLGGSVAQYQGDGVIVRFGYPRAHEDDARRAVRCGLSIIDQIPQLQSFPGVNLAVRVGIATGLVVVGDQVGSEPTLERAAVGSAPNIAARLQAVAGPGDVVIAPSTRRLIADSFELADLGTRTIKGIEQPLHLWRVVGEKPPAVGLEPRTPFVGRQVEREHCQNIVAACRCNGRGQIIYVRGEAGIGKTRFVEEVTHAAEAEGFTSHRGVVLDFGTGGGQDPIRSLVQSLLGIEFSSDQEARRSAAEAAIAADILSAGQRIFLEDLLGVPHGTDTRALYDAMDNDARNRGRREVLTTLVARLSERRSRLIIVEDLHWSDPPTLSDLTAFALGVGISPALLIMTSRLDGDPLDITWRADIGSIPFTTINLDPLRSDEAICLARTLARTPDTVTRTCTERAAGNPLFLEQLLRNAEEGTGEAIPASIHGLVVARIDRLSATDKRALQVASILGQRFDLTTLRHLLEEDEYSCKTLTAVGLLRRDSEVHMFAHALIRDAVYDTLLKKRRRELHRQAAVWFADRGELVLRAQHLDRAEDPEATRAYLEAAQSQSAAYHYEAALQLIGRGIMLARDAAERSTLTCCKGDILHDLGAITDARDAYDCALDAATDDVERCRAWIGLAAVKRITDDLPGAVTDLDRAERVAMEHDSLLADQARIHYLRGNLCFPRGDIAGCLREHSKSLDLARRAGAAGLEAVALGGLGDSEYMVGRMLSARRYFDRCIELCQRHGFGRVEVANRPMAAFTRWFAGDVRGALKDAGEAIAAAATVGHSRGEMIARHAAYLCRHALMDFGSAWDDVERALAVARQLGARRFEGEALAFRAELHRMAARRSQALADLRDAIAIFRETGMAFMGPMALGIVALATEDAEERVSALLEAETLLAAGAVSHNHLLFRRDAIDACLAVGAWDEADHHASALEEFTRQEPLPWSDFFVARGRALAACERGQYDSALLIELSRLRAQGERLGLLSSLPAIERAQAAGRDG
jgi:class 3 adenylate cyclase/tetratricopeptide (TPR) repeat protein